MHRRRLFGYQRERTDPALRKVRKNRPVRTQIPHAGLTIEILRVDFHIEQPGRPGRHPTSLFRPFLWLHSSGHCTNHKGTSRCPVLKVRDTSASDGEALFQLENANRFFRSADPDLVGRSTASDSFEGSISYGDYMHPTVRSLNMPCPLPNPLPTRNQICRIRHVLTHLNKPRRT